MSNYIDHKEHKKAIFDQLILSGYTKNYIRRALKVYERNYGVNYNTDVIAEIIRRLQKKDKNKAKQSSHTKSHSETFDISQAFPPQPTHSKHNNNNNNKNTQKHYEMDNKIDNNECDEYEKGDIVQYKQYTAEIINIADKGRSLEISYPINGYSEYHRKRIWVNINDIKYTVKVAQNKNKHKKKKKKDKDKGDAMLLLDKPSTNYTQDNDEIDHENENNERILSNHIRSSKSFNGNDSSEISMSNQSSHPKHHRSRSSNNHHNHSHNRNHSHQVFARYNKHNNSHSHRYDYGGYHGHNGHNNNNNEHLKLMKWINILKTCIDNKNNNPFHNDLIVTFDELKEYILNNPNWEYLIKYNVLNVISYLITSILNKKYVNIWHKIITLSLDILIILIDYYLKLNNKHKNNPYEYVIKAIIDIMRYYDIMLDYNIKLSSILISCCSILGKLTFENNENIQCVLSCNGIDEILNMIGECKNGDGDGKDECNYNSLIISCLNLLCVLCYNSNYNKQFISNNGASVAILDLLKHFVSLKYHIGDQHIIMMTSILRTLGNFTFIGKNIRDLLDDSLLRILYKLVTEIDCDSEQSQSYHQQSTVTDGYSNMLILCMQILSDIAAYTNNNTDHEHDNIESFLISSILKLGRKNKECILLQECMLNGIAILINLQPEKNGRLLIQQKGELQIFDRIKELNYPSNIVILSLRTIKAMCLAHNDIASHLVKQSNVFNFLTHIMKHWRLKEQNKHSLESSLRIQCCCKVIRSLTNIAKFSKYANKCHVISGLIKILMINDDDNNDKHERISHILFIEIIKTFIAICIDEENCIKLAKHGTKCILSGIHIYSLALSSPLSSERDSTLSSTMTSNQNNQNEKYIRDIIKFIGILFCNISKYASVSTYLHNYNAVEMAYNILCKYIENVFICNQFILFLSNMLLSQDEVYHLLETKLQCQSLINKILYLHSNYDPLIKTCHKYHKSIELWLRNNSIKNNSNIDEENRIKRFPIFSNEIIENPYNIDVDIQFKIDETQWMSATVIDHQNNWIVIRFIPDDDSDNIVYNDRKIHVLKYKHRLRFLHIEDEDDDASDSVDEDDEDDDDDDEDEEDINISQQRQYEMNVFLNETQRFNWNLIGIDDNNENGKNSLFKCFYSEIYGNGHGHQHENNKHKVLKKEVEEYKLENNDYFKHLLFNKTDKDFISMIALSELYSVRIRVFFIGKRNRNKLTLLYDIGSFNETLCLPSITLASLYNHSHYFIIQDINSFNIHPRPLINHQNSENNEIDLRQFRFTKFYEKLFNYFDIDCDGQLNGEQIYDFFVSSNLNTDILRTIWDESVGDNCPTMNLQQFIIAMTLILRQQTEEREQEANNTKFPIIIKHGSFNIHGGNNDNKKRKINVSKYYRKQRENGNEQLHRHGPHSLNRNSANDANSLNDEYNILNAGVANLKYPINPFDILNIGVVDQQQQVPQIQQSINNTENEHDVDDEYHENMIAVNHSGNSKQMYLNGYTNYTNMRERLSNSTKTKQTNSKTTNTNYKSVMNFNKKTDEFLRFYNEINFGNKQIAEIYYDRIAEFEYNDIEKMMELDHDILIDEFEMNQDHAIILINKINKFIKNHKIFKKWLLNQLKMRRYFVKFVNEGVLTFDIFLSRFQSFHDLIPVIGQKNVNDTKVLFRKLPNKYKII